MKQRSWIFFIFFGVLVVLPAMQAWATFISPKRVMIEDKERAAKLTIQNGTDQTLAYRFEWEQRAQNPNGPEVVLLKEGEVSPGYKPLGDIIQFSPRQVILKPGEHQKIRFLVKRPADLAEGEYHSHFLIKTERVDEDQIVQEANGNTVSGTLMVRANVSIPVFVRQGATSVGVNLKSASLTQITKGAAIRVAIGNESTRSLYIKPELVCNDAQTATLQTIKLYAEAKSLEDSILIPKDFAYGSCSSLKLRLLGTDDFEYPNKMITEVNVTR